MGLYVETFFYYFTLQPILQKIRFTFRNKPKKGLFLIEKNMSQVYDEEDNDSCSTETNLLLDYKWWEDKPFQTTLKETKNEKEKSSSKQVSTKSSEKEESKTLTTSSIIEQKKLYYDVEENTP